MNIHLNILRTLAATLFTLTTFTSHAHEYKLGNIEINHPWARATVAGQSVGGGFLTIKNKGTQNDQLVAVEWARSKTVELHTHSMDQGVMKMRQVPNIPVPAGSTVELKPGSLHVMFIDLKQPLTEGEKINATLIFEKTGKVNVDFKVESLQYKNDTTTKHAH